MIAARLAWLVAAVVPLLAGDRIGSIEFFGYGGLDAAVLRAALPVREGDAYTEDVKAAVGRAAAAAAGVEVTDVAAICCDDTGDRLVFVGLAGGSYRSFAYLPQPGGAQRLPRDIVDLYARVDRAIYDAVRKGGDAAREDDSRGYALIRDPEARALQLSVRRWAVRHQSELLAVLEQSSSAEERRVASDALGYAQQSRTQIAALVRAARDPDDEVRNNATRALGVLVRSNRKLAAQVTADPFIAMLSAGIWTDRNKGASLLVELTAVRNAALLARIQERALDALVEMARWRKSGHAYFARVLLGRIGGIPEERLTKLAWDGPVEEIVAAAHRLPH